MSNETISESVIADLLKEIDRATAKHPFFPCRKHPAFALIAEEYLELTRAINDNESDARVIEEAFHTAVTLIRFMTEKRKNPDLHAEDERIEENEE